MDKEVDSGESLHGWFASFDPDTSSWRMCQLSLLEGLDAFSETWPQAGTMRNGRVYARPTLERPTEENDSSFWPTPNAIDGRMNLSLEQWEKKQARAWEKHGDVWRPSLAIAVKMWPTPTVKGNYNRQGASAKSGDGLATAVGGALNPTWVEWLMGFPLEWTALDASAMPSFRRSRKSSGG